MRVLKLGSPDLKASALTTGPHYFLIQERVTTYTERLLHDGIIDSRTKSFLFEPNPKPGRFYILPKIQKHGNPGRRIVSSNSHPTERLLQFVDYHLKPLAHIIQASINGYYALSQQTQTA